MGLCPGSFPCEVCDRGETGLGCEREKWEIVDDHVRIVDAVFIAPIVFSLPNDKGKVTASVLTRFHFLEGTGRAINMANHHCSHILQLTLGHLPILFSHKHS